MPSRRRLSVLLNGDIAVVEHSALGVDRDHDPFEQGVTAAIRGFTVSFRVVLLLAQLENCSFVS